MRPSRLGKRNVIVCKWTGKWGWPSFTDSVYITLLKIYIGQGRIQDFKLGGRT